LSSIGIAVWVWAMLTPWSRVPDLVRRCISRVRRRATAAVERKFDKKSAHIPHHKSRKV
jgi:hypothetical protein